MRVKTFLILAFVLLMALPSLAQRASWAVDGRYVSESRLNFDRDAGLQMLQNPATTVRSRLGLWRHNVSATRLDTGRLSLLHRTPTGQPGVTGVNWHLAAARIQENRYQPILGGSRVTSADIVRASSLMRAGHRQIASRLEPQSTQALFARPSNYFNPTPKISRNPAPDPMLPVEAAAKNSLALFVQAKSDNGMFAVPDPMTKSYWNTWLVSNPKLRKVGRDYVAQAGFYGSAPGSTDVYPMVVQFRLEGANKSWHVRDVKLVTVNNVARPGVAQFLRFVEGRDGTVGVEEIKPAL